MEKSLDQCSLCDSTANVTTDGALLGLAANHRVAANNFPHSPATFPSIQSHQSCCDQHSFVSHSAPFESSTAGSKQCDSQGGARPKNKDSAIPNNAHLNSNVCKGPGLTGTEPCFITRHTQDDYYKNPEKAAANLNNRIVHIKNCMTGPFTGYGASPWPSYRSVGSGGLSAHNRVDPPSGHVQAGSDYAPGDTAIRQSGIPSWHPSTMVRGNSK